MTVASAKDNLSDNSSAAVLVCAQLAERFGNRFSKSGSVREQHGHTTTWLPNQTPDGVVFPQTTEEVAEIVKLCAAHDFPIIPFGAGSSLEGHVNAPFGGISIDLTNMNAVLEVNAEDLDCSIQAGITRKQLNVRLRDTGLFFPIDPGADATLGGMAATRASGTNAVRYGTMRENVLGLTVVMPDGQIIKTGGRARKSSAGYDLTHLMIGSEGTLGIITELTMKLHGIPESIAGGLCPFNDLDAACNAVIMTIQSGLPVARIELLDDVQIKACNQYSNLSLKEKPTLFLEFHGTEHSVREQSERFGDIAREFGSDDFVWATQAEERTRLWKARHDAFWAGKAYRPGHAAVTTDVCVPISQLATCIHQTRDDIDKLDVTAAIVGHVGDGNFHVLVLFDDKIPGLNRKVEDFVATLNERAIDLGGTCTGEHGIGQGKKKYLQREHGGAVEIMRQLKRTLDPKGIMNPGKIF